MTGCDVCYSTSLQPFLDPSSALHSFFLPRYYSVAIPVFLLVVGLTGIGAFLGSVMIKSGKKKAA